MVDEVSGKPAWVYDRDFESVLACYSGAGFTAELTDVAANDRHVLLVDLARLFQET